MVGRGGTSASFFHDHLAIAGKFLDRSFLNDYSQIVGRLRRFDEASAVDAAAAVFRRRGGYTAASVDDLVEATGVHRGGSLYNAFGSKHGLFLRALDAAAAPDADPDERLDLLMVALLELAAVDARVRDHVSNIISEKKDVTAGQLGKRLLSRAEVDDEGEPE